MRGDLRRDSHRALGRARRGRRRPERPAGDAHPDLARVGLGDGRRGRRGTQPLPPPDDAAPFRLRRRSGRATMSGRSSPRRRRADAGPPPGLDDDPAVRRRGRAVSDLPFRASRRHHQRRSRPRPPGNGCSQRGSHDPSLPPAARALARRRDRGGVRADGTRPTSSELHDAWRACGARRAEPALRPRRASDAAAAAAAASRRAAVRCSGPLLGVGRRGATTALGRRDRVGGAEGGPGPVALFSAVTVNV